MKKIAATEEEPEGNIASRTWDKAQGKWSEIDPEIRKLLATGTGGAALGGGLGWLLTGDRKGESPAARKRRILSNALLGTALGGVAGVALPKGLDMMQDATTPTNDDVLEDLGMSGALTGIGAAAGGIGMSKTPEVYSRLMQYGDNSPAAYRKLLNDRLSGAGLAVQQGDIKGQKGALQNLINSGNTVTENLSNASDWNKGGLGTKVNSNLIKLLESGNIADADAALEKSFKRTRGLKRLGKGSLLAGGIGGGAYLGDMISQPTTGGSVLDHLKNLISSKGQEE